MTEQLQALSAQKYSLAFKKKVLNGDHSAQKRKLNFNAQLKQATDGATAAAKSKANTQLGKVNVQPSTDELRVANTEVDPYQPQETAPQELNGLAGDVDGDGRVSSKDIGHVIAAWGQEGSAADVNGDGTVDQADIDMIRSNWTQEQAASTSRDENVGDTNGDGVVDATDLGYLLSKWGSEDATADLNGDGNVDNADVDVLKQNWTS